VSGNTLSHSFQNSHGETKARNLPSFPLEMDFNRHWMVLYENGITVTGVLKICLREKIRAGMCNL